MKDTIRYVSLMSRKGVKYNMVIDRKQCAAPTRREWASRLANFIGSTRASLALLTAADLLGASEFWNKKDPSAWTSDEVLQLATKSPWAKTGRVLPRPGRDRGSFQQPGPDLGGGGTGRGSNPKLGEVPVVPVAEVTVVWASAQPLLDALKSSFPADFANHYVIGVNDLPATEGGRKVNQDSMAANLQVRGKDSTDAGGVLPARGTVLFAFSKELLPLSVSDKEVLFTLDTNQFSVKVRFDLKEMTYRGKLAV
jgi:hypothetical protein